MSAIGQVQPTLTLLLLRPLLLCGEHFFALRNAAFVVWRARVCINSVNQTGRIKFKQPIALGPEGAGQPTRADNCNCWSPSCSLTRHVLWALHAGEECFMQTKSLLFRSNKVRRIYDKTSNSLIYVSYRCAVC